jgi:hypothetical protein
MKITAVLAALVLMFSIAGCAKKTASEQLRDDMKKAGNRLDKDIKNVF